MVLCIDELGPVTPRTFPPVPAWSVDGHRIKYQVEYSRGPDKAWIYGALAPSTGQTITMSAHSRNSETYCEFLALLEDAYPSGKLYLIADNLSTHLSRKTRTWLAEHPRIHQVFIPSGAAWLNLIEAWWRLFRREALAGQTFADYAEIQQAARLAAGQLNSRAHPWVWGRPLSPPRQRRHTFIYRI